MTDQMSSQRQLRFSELIRSLISECLLVQDFYNLSFETTSITISYVRMSKDLRQANIYVMPLGGQSKEKIIEELDSVRKKIESLELKIKSKVGEDQKLFGSVTTASIAAELKKEDIDVEKKYIMINGVNIIKTIGSFSATIRLHRGLTANLSFEVVAEKA